MGLCRDELCIAMVWQPWQEARKAVKAGGQAQKQMVEGSMVFAAICSADHVPLTVASASETYRGAPRFSEAF